MVNSRARQRKGHWLCFDISASIPSANLQCNRMEERYWPHLTVLFRNWLDIKERGFRQGHAFKCSHRMRSSVSALLLVGCICLIQGLHIVFDKPQNTSGNSRIAKSPKEASNVRLYDERTVRHSSDYSRIELLRLCKGRNEVFSTCHPSCNVTCKNYRSCIPQSSLCLIRNCEKFGDVWLELLNKHFDHLNYCR